MSQTYLILMLISSFCSPRPEPCSANILMCVVKDTGGDFNSEPAMKAAWKCMEAEKVRK